MCVTEVVFLDHSFFFAGGREIKVVVGSANSSADESNYREL